MIPPWPRPRLPHEDQDVRAKHAGKLHKPALIVSMDLAKPGSDSSCVQLWERKPDGTMVLLNQIRGCGEMVWEVPKLEAVADRILRAARDRWAKLRRWWRKPTIEDPPSLAPYGPPDWLS